MTVQTPAPSPAGSNEIKAGVIEDARTRQRRHRRIGTALIATAALVGGLLIGLESGGGGRSGTGHSASGPPGVHGVPAAWINVQQRANTESSRQSSGCPTHGFLPGAHQIVDRAPPEAMTSLLRVLGQPAAGRARVSTAVISRLALDARGVYIRYARQGTTDGITYYLIPAAHLGYPLLPARCYTQQLADFQSLAAGLPTTERRNALDWERRMISVAEAGGSAGVELLTEGGGVGGKNTITLEQLRADPYGIGGSGGNNKITETALIVTNNVASVTARYSTQGYPGRVAQPVTETRSSVNNLVVFVFRGAWDPPTLTYRSASGASLSSVLRSQPRQVANPSHAQALSRKPSDLNQRRTPLPGRPRRCTPSPRASPSTASSPGPRASARSA